MILEAEAFADKMEEIGGTAVQLIAKEVAALVFEEVADNILRNTPIATGQARNNWNPSVDTPDETIVSGSTELGDSDFNTGAPVTGSEKERLNQAVHAFLASPGASKLCLTNALSYIGGLEDGNSDKAPGGMVAVGIPAALAKLSDAKITAQVSLEAVQSRGVG
jgi:hypothetical protein